MARIARVTLVDDIDGGVAQQTVAFSFGRTDYEIDLSAQHAADLRDLLGPYVGAARRVGGRGGRRPSVASGSVSRVAGRSRGEAAAIREWAAANGYAVPARGRISSAVLHAYARRGSAALASPDVKAAATAKTIAPARSIDEEAVGGQPVGQESVKPRRRGRKAADQN